MASCNSSDGKLVPSIDVNNLSYAFPDGSTGLEGVNLHLPPGSRTLLIGGSKAQHAFIHTFSNAELQLTAQAKQRSSAYSPENAWLRPAPWL